jgi:hypothetical protein
MAHNKRALIYKVIKYRSQKEEDVAAFLSKEQINSEEYKQLQHMSLQELYEHFDECCADEEVTI